MKLLFFFAAVCIAVLSFSPAEAFETDTDRPGMDYKNFNLTAADPALCENACNGDAACKAWTYVKPQIQGPQPRCWLKTSVTAPKSNTCCVSGVKQKQMQMLDRAIRETPERIPGDLLTLTPLNPDLSLTSLTVKLIQKYSPNSGKIEIKATAVNNGPGVVKNKGWIQICEMESAKSYHCLKIAQVDFPANVIKPGHHVDVVQTRDFKGDCSNLLNAPRYKVNIYYYLNPGQQQGKMYPEIDTNFLNNELEKDSSEICNMLK